MTRKISIDPITRLEGHGKIEIFLDDDGAVQDTFFQIPELRGFERFVVGRPIEELPRIVTRICGVCPASHHMASAKAVDGCFGDEVAPLAHKLRDMYYHAHYIHSHIAHFYALAAPDFVLGPDADPATRNILGVVAKVGLEIGGAVIRRAAWRRRSSGSSAAATRRTSGACPAASPRGSSPRSSNEIKPMVDELYDFTQFSLQLFRDVVLGNPTYVDLIVNGPYTLDVHNMGLVDENNAPNFYDGKVRVVDFEGKEICKYAPDEYADYVAEHVEPWTYLKFPYLKQRGWKGFDEGIDSSALHRHAALAPQRRRPHGDAQGPGGLRGDVRDPRRPSLQGAARQPLGAARRDGPERRDARALLRRPRDHRRPVPRRPAADHRRGRRHRRGDARHAHPPLHLRRERDLHQRQPHRRHHQQQRPHPDGDQEGRPALIQPGKEPDQGILNMVEMAFRAFDPCYSCATHSLPGQMPLEVRVHRGGEVTHHFKRGC